MLLRNLLSLDPQVALAINQPNDVVFSVDPRSFRVEAHRVMPGATSGDG